VEARLREHAYVAAVEAGLASMDSLRAFVGEQQAIITSDLRSVAQLVARQADPDDRAFFLATLDGERAALVALEPLAAAVGVTAAETESYEPRAGCYAYACYMAWLGAYGSAAEVAAAYLVNFQAWAENCRRLANGLQLRYGLDENAVRFFSQFADISPDFEPAALGVIERGLARGVEPGAVRRAARLLQAYELLYWDSLVMSDE
jgi:thiaminase